MSNLDQQTFRDIVNLLIPHCADPASRKSLATTAFFGCNILDQIEYTGSSQDYVVYLIRTLLTFGDCVKDKPSLIALLEELQKRVGVSQQEYILDLISRIPQNAKFVTKELVLPKNLDKYVFVSYSREDSKTVKCVATDLLNKGINVWIDEAGLKAGTVDWEQALRDAIHDARVVLYMASPSARRSAYVRDELAIADMEEVKVYPVWIEGEHWMDCIPMGRGYTQFIDMRGGAYAAGLQQLVESLAANINDDPIKPEVIVDASKPIRNPYKGLRAFRAEDANDFFGRDGLIEELIEILGTGTKPPRMLAVLGASGSGKSSVIMAGLLPHLRNGAIEGSEDWLYLDPIVPSGHPIENLTIALWRQMQTLPQMAIREDLMNRNKRGLHALTSGISDKPVVLYIDQFEELFTLVNDEAERQQFIDLLTTAITEQGGKLIVILSMRADFYDRPMHYAEFGALVQKNHVAVQPMSLADLYDVVQQPAQLDDVGLAFDDGLVTEMVFAVREDIAALPLLQFTLDQLFEQRDQRRLTLKAYNEMGGIQGALAQHAESTFAELPSDRHRTLARTLFLRLIEAGTSEQDTTRRRISTDEIDFADIEAKRIVREVADAFVNARLLVSDKREYRETLEVSHEALIREWNRLSEWLHEAREDLRLQKALSADVAEWKRRSEPREMLYRGIVLAETEAWAKRNTPNRDEERFICEAIQAETEDKESQRRIAQRVQNFQRASVVLGVIVVLAVGVIFVATNLLTRANEARIIAQDLKIQAQASATRLADSVAFFSIQQNRVATQAAGGVVVPALNTTLDPTAFVATETQIAVLNSWQPVEKTDEFDVVMVEVPPGCFNMGSVAGVDQQPINSQCFNQSFWIDKFEVTKEQYNRLVGEAVALVVAEPHHPVDAIPWFDARDVCRLRGARLPSEAEWEYAARGPDSLIYPWGNEFVEDAAVYNRPFSAGTLPVMNRNGQPLRPQGASWVGAIDMAGNVWEWTNTRFDDIDYSQQLFDYQHLYSYPYNPDDGRESDETREEFEARIPIYTARSFRGGSFGSADVRSAGRNKDYPNISLVGAGFRCARSQP